MSDTTAVHPDLARPEPRRSWRESWRESASRFADTLDLSPLRLAVGLVAIVVGGLVAWRLLAPPDPPAEMTLPFAQAQSSPAGGSRGRSSAGADTGADGGGGPGDGASGAASGASGAGGPQGTPTPAGAAAPDETTDGAVSSGTAPSTGSAEVVVHVAGAVTTPGVQRLPAGARVVDAVDGAGGATTDADLARVNLAAVAQDGQQVYVPRVGEEVPPSLGAGSSAASSAGAEASSSGQAGLPARPVDINTATPEQLDTLPGVGPATSRAIISHRERNGPFTSVDDLLDVRGIGQAKLDALRDLVTV